MPHSFGKRARTRDKYSLPFRKHGVKPIAPLLVPYKKGDYVNVVCDPSQQKGMPYSYYHGKTGRIFGIFKNSVGVEINKVVKHREIRKMILVRADHVKLSKVKQIHKEIVQKRDKVRRELKAQGKSSEEIRRILKRQPKGPKSEVKLFGVEKLVKVVSHSKAVPEAMLSKYRSKCNRL